MERTGTITAVSGDTLEVTFCRPGDCEKCHACIGGEKKHVLLVKGEGHVGDAAVVSLPETDGCQGIRAGVSFAAGGAVRRYAAGRAGCAAE